MSGARTRVKIEKKKDEKRYVAVKTVWQDSEATDLLQQGWTLLHGGIAHATSDGYQAKSCYVLGLQK